MLLKIYELDLLKEIKQHRDKLLWTIKEHNKYRSLKYLPKLPKLFSIVEFNLLTNKNYNYGATWIKKRFKDDFMQI